MQGRPDALAQRFELPAHYGGDRLVNLVEADAETVCRRAREPTFVAFGLIVEEGDKARLFTGAGRDKTVGDDGGVEAAGYFGDDAIMPERQRLDRTVDHRRQGVRAVVPAVRRSDEADRRPQGRLGHVPSDVGQTAGIDGLQSRQGQGVGGQIDRAGDIAEHGPVDRQIVRQDRVQRFRRLAGDEGGRAVPPADAVERAARIAQQVETAVVVAPDHDVTSPALTDHRPGERLGGMVQRHERGQRHAVAPPLPDQEVTTVNLDDLERRARTEIDAQPFDLEGLAPARRQQPPHRTIGFGRRGSRPIDDHIAPKIGRGRRHRQ